MNREDIIRMVQEVADKDKVDPYSNGFVVLTPEEMERFATIIVAAEREACAQVVEAIDRNGAWVTKQEAAAAIRARSKQCG